MNVSLWIMAGGLLGMGIAYFSRGKGRGDFFISVIAGVFVIILSSYIILPYVKSSAQLFQPLLFSLMSVCGMGYMLLRKSHESYHK